MKLEHKVFLAEVKEFDDEQLTVTHFISTERRDRGGDSMKADGMKIRGKVVVLLAHGFSGMGQEPIAKPIKIWPDIFKGSPGICAMTQFYDGSHLNPPDNTGRRLYDKTKNGYMPNWSIGWIPIKWEDIKGPHGEYYRDVLEWELLEYSPVGVPMNPDCQTADKSGKCNVDKCGSCQKEAWFKVLLVGTDVHKEEFKHYGSSDGKSLLEDDADQDGDGREAFEEKFGDLCQYKDDLLCDMEGKPYPNEHACRINDPKKYDRIRRKNDKFGKGIHALWGIKKGNPVELQAIRFSKSKFTPAEARKWCKDHEYKCKPFEPASEKCATCGAEMVWKWFLEDEEDGIYSCETCKDIKSKKNECKCDNEKCGHTVAWSNNCHGMKCLKCGKGTLKKVKKTKKDLGDELETKGVIKYKKTPLAKENEPWSGPGEKAKATVDDLKIMCTWFDSDNPDVKGSYALPHHKAGGEHACVWNGVRAAAAALMGARGGVKKIPANDIPGCKTHLASHYKDFDKGDAPWKKEIGIQFMKAAEGFMDMKNGIGDEALYAMAQGMLPELAEFFEPEGSKGVIPYKKTPSAKDDEPWNLKEEVGKASLDDLREMAVWVDEKRPKSKASYKGIHHKSGGDHLVVKKAVKALASNLLNSRGGIHIPTVDLKKAREHCAAHYEDLGMGEPPWKKKEGLEFIAWMEITPVTKPFSGKREVEDQKIVFDEAQKLIPELAEFFDPEYKQDDWGYGDDGDGTGDDVEPNLTENETVVIEMIDGQEIRDRMDNLGIEYTMGGHHYVYPDLVPEENKIIVDARMSDEDIIATKCHEFIERQLMKYYGFPYNDAHEIANIGEEGVRHILKDCEDGGHGGVLGDGRNHDSEHRGNHHHDHGRTVDHTWEQDALDVVESLYSTWDEMKKLGQHDDGCTFDSICPTCKTPVGKCDKHDEAMAIRVAKMDKVIANCEEKIGQSIDLNLSSDVKDEELDSFIDFIKTMKEKLNSIEVKLDALTVKSLVGDPPPIKDKTNQDPQKIVAINGGDEEKRMLVEISKQLSKEFSDLITQYEENTRKLIRSEINKAKGKVE